MTLWLLLFAMGAVTYAIRLSVIALLGRIEIPPIVRAGLKYVPTAVLSAIIAPALLRPDGPFNLSISNVRLLAGLIATAVAWRTKNVLLTIVVGMGVMWVLGRVL